MSCKKKVHTEDSDDDMEDEDYVPENDPAAQAGEEDLFDSSGEDLPSNQSLLDQRGNVVKNKEEDDDTSDSSESSDADVEGTPRQASGTPANDKKQDSDKDAQVEEPAGGDSSQPAQVEEPAGGDSCLPAPTKDNTKGGEVVNEGEDDTGVNEEDDTGVNEEMEADEDVLARDLEPKDLEEVEDSQVDPDSSAMKRKLEKAVMEQLLKTDLKLLADRHPDEQRHFLAQAACIAIRSTPLLKKLLDSQKIYTAQRRCDRDLLVQISNKQQEMKATLDMLLQRVCFPSPSGEGAVDPLAVDQAVVTDDGLPRPPLNCYDDLKTLFKCEVFIYVYIYFTYILLYHVRPNQ